MPEYGLGRLVQHDPRSRGFAAPRATERRSVSWRHYGAVLDQGRLGSCTGNAMAQWLNCKPGHKPRAPYMTEAEAVELYSRATQVDPWDGEYPPTDSGSSGLAVAKAAQERGWITGYTWAFGLEHCLDALALGPVMVGTVWTQSMFEPVDGFLQPNGAEVGGHEYVLTGMNVRKSYVWMLNSWGADWSSKGRAKISFDALDHLLKQDGDCTVPSAV